MNKQTFLVTGGAGFIGSAFIRMMSKSSRIINFDSMTYAGDLSRLSDIDSNQYLFVKGDICDEALVKQTLAEYRPIGIINFAAESHVDRSIDGPQVFLKTNIEGTMNLLRCATHYWSTLDKNEQNSFRFLHVSTDEVYGSLDLEDDSFTELSPYKPNSPYAASKASSDHFVRAWNKTYKLPTLITHCSNNYGPWQFPEKLIPLMISKCLNLEPLPIYGDGSNIRDWIHVDDHVRGIETVLKKANPGTVWSIGGETEVSNLTLVTEICEVLDSIYPRKDEKKYIDQLTFVQDRPGHDKRYSVNIEKIKSQLGWTPSISFKEGLQQTIKWYLENNDWVAKVSKQSQYKQERLGILSSNGGK